ncbi:transglutaminaseTgpA domain-containing protein [Piscinibacter sakaiensis]|uniref:transglutaminase family protein n=1 Tax=Piscinibacter sakaiensis TaxID=1547922 RepID=UPI003AAA3858
MPRESRDTLFLLAVIAWTVLPHTAQLPLWCSALTAGVLAWRARLAITLAPLPGRWWLVALLLLATVGTFASFGSLLGKQPGVTMAVVLMALKTLELRARRDAFVVFFLGFFLVLTHFLFSQSLLVALAMLVSVWGLLTALVLAHMPVGQPALRQAAGLAARTALWGAPIMALLFVFFPRIGPLWGVPQDAGGKTGLSSRMQMGSIAELAQDDSVAMRLRFLDGRGAPPPQSQYFRGPVFGRFDGREWRVIGAQLPSVFPSALRPAAELQVDGQPRRYEMTLEPLKLAVLPLLEVAVTPPQIDGYAVRQRSDLQWLVERPVFERLRFTAEAYARFRHGPLDPVLGLQEYVELPPGYNPRTLAWAVALRRQPGLAEADATTLAQAVLQHIGSAGFSYTLAPGIYGETDPYGAIDEFWLDRREGFCEHFAAAFVVVMRALDIPARIVTGYQGIDPFPIDGYYTVRQSAAHAWAEYWVAGRGWLRADPTAAVAPERIRGNLLLRPTPGLVAETWGRVSPAFLGGLRDFWDAANNRWNQWVLSYTRGHQIGLLKAIGLDAATWQDLALLLIGSLSGLALAVATWAWWDHARVDPWQRQRELLRRRLVSLGIESAPHEPPRALAARVRQRLGEQGFVLAELLEQLDLQHYGPAARSRPDSGLTRRFLAEARLIARAASV